MKIIDAKFGQSISLRQADIFARWAAARGGSVTYITLTRPPAALIAELVKIGAARGAPVKIIPILWRL